MRDSTARSVAADGRTQRAAAWYIRAASTESRSTLSPPRQALRTDGFRMRAAFCGARCCMLSASCCRRWRCLASRRRAAAPQASLCHRHARRAGHAGRLYGAALCQSRRAEGRPAGRGRARHVRQPQSAHRPGSRRAADPRLRGREPDGARLRRAVHALRPVGAHASRPTMRAATSPSRSIRRRISPTARRSPPRTWCSPGSCCATTAGPIIAPTIPRSPRPRSSIHAPCVSISPAASDRELPLILGLMPVLPKHAIDVATFENTTLAKPIGSGPYVVADVDAGKSVTFKRDPNYWGRALRDQSRPVEFRRGALRFLSRRQRLFRSVQGRPLRRAQRDRSEPLADRLRLSRRARRPRRQGNVPDGLPKFASDFVFNTRRPIFADIRVRQAIALLFDFQWINRNFFYDLYQRSASFFDDSRAVRLPPPGRSNASARCLRPIPDAVRPDVLDGTWSPPVTDGSGRDRATLRQALGLARRRRLRARGHDVARPRQRAAVQPSRSW